MATNVIKNNGAGIRHKMTVATGLGSGEPVEFGTLLHGWTHNAADSNDEATCVLNAWAIIDVEVEAVDNAGNSAVALYDVIYYDSAATIKLNKDVTNGNVFGVALETVSAGNSDTIKVALL